MTSLYALIASASVGVLAVLLFIALVPRRICPKCNHSLPRIRLRKPSELGDAIQGGWRCQNCGARVALNGKLMSD